MGRPRAVFERTVKPPYVAVRRLVTEALERRAGIRTEGFILPEDLGISPQHHGHYQPTHWLGLRRILSPREVGPQDVFLDVGSGMGRVVYQAARHYRFRRVIGVELSDHLHAIAVDNIERNRHRLRCQDVQLLCTDARAYEIPDDVTVVYVYNPFSGPVFAASLESLLASFRRNPRTIRLIYRNPIEEQRVLAAGFRVTKASRGLRPGRAWSRSNSTRCYELTPDLEAAASNRAHWERIGAAYTGEWDPPARRRIGERELELILDGLRATSGRTALDIGIGNGRILDGLLRGAPTVQVWGVDIAGAMVETTRERFAGEPRVRELRVCDVAHEPLPFELEFDFVSAIRMLKYNENWREIVAALAERLGAGGVLVLSISNRRSLNRISREYAIEGFDVTLADVRTLCRRLGLEVLREDGFTKLPHFVSSGARSPLAIRAVIGIDAALRRLIGGPALAREIFVVAHRS